MPRRTLTIQLAPADAKFYETATPEQQHNVDEALRKRLHELVRELLVRELPEPASAQRSGQSEALLPPRRHRENAWRRTHEAELAAYAGQWVVLEGETIITHGTKPARLIEKAKGQGVQIPYVFYVEELTPDVAMMGL